MTEFQLVSFPTKTLKFTDHIPLNVSDQCSDSVTVFDSNRTGNSLEQNTVNCRCVVIYILTVFSRRHPQMKGVSPTMNKNINKAC